MKLFIKHVAINYVDATTREDVEPDLMPVNVEVHYEFHHGPSKMTAKLDMDYREYEGKNHAELVEFVTGQVKQMFT